MQFAYDAAHRRTTLTLPNSVSTQYGYDAASQLTALIYKLGGSTLGDLQYLYDAAGNRIQVDGTWARTGVPSTVASATYNANNQQLTFGSQSLTYDLNGNLTSDGANTYTWDARNRLAATTGPVPASFTYDAAGRRGRQTINGVVTDFLYDGPNPTQEQSGSNITSLLNGLGVDEYFRRGDASSTSFFLADALGSTVALSDSSGNLVKAYSYEPFGGTSATGSPPSPYDFTGRETDATGLKYYRARYYHPGLARFITEDPIGFGGGLNLYAYVENNPVLFDDPFGLDKNRRCRGPALYSAIGPNQALGAGALNLFPSNGDVAIDPRQFGLPFPEDVAARIRTQRILALLARQIKIYPQGFDDILSLYGGPTSPFTVADIGDANIRASFLPRFDIYRFSSRRGAYGFGIRGADTIIEMPPSLQCPSAPGWKQIGGDE